MRIPGNPVISTTGQKLSLPIFDKEETRILYDYKDVGSWYGKVQQTLTHSAIPGLKRIVTMQLEWT